MFGMITPIEAISFGLKAGMMLGQTQTLWAARVIQMQGFWFGYPMLGTGLSKAVTSELPAAALPVRALHVEAMAAQPPALPAPKPAPARKAKPDIAAAPAPSPLAAELSLRPVPRRNPAKPPVPLTE